MHVPGRVPRLMLAALALAAGACGRAAAQVDPGAPAGAVQTAASLREVDRYALPVGTFALDAPAVREVSGAVARMAWRLDAPEAPEKSGGAEAAGVRDADAAPDPAGAPGPAGPSQTPEATEPPEAPAEATVAGVMQGYRERLRALGFEPVWECADEACGGFDFRFGAEILPPPGMLVDVRDFAQLSAERSEPAGPPGFVSVLVSRVLDSIYVQTVSVEPGQAAGETVAAAPEGSEESPEPPGDAVGVQEEGPGEAPAGDGAAPAASTEPVAPAEPALPAGGRRCRRAGRRARRARSVPG